MRLNWAFIFAFCFLIGGQFPTHAQLSEAIDTKLGRLSVVCKDINADGVGSLSLQINSTALEGVSGNCSNNSISAAWDIAVLDVASDDLYIQLDTFWTVWAWNAQIIRIESDGSYQAIHLPLVADVDVVSANKDGVVFIISTETGMMDDDLSPDYWECASIVDFEQKTAQSRLVGTYDFEIPSDICDHSVSFSE